LNIKQFIVDCSLNTDIIACWSFGSFANKQLNKYSDVDILLLVEDHFVIDFLPLKINDKISDYKILKKSQLKNTIFQKGFHLKRIGFDNKTNILSGGFSFEYDCYFHIDRAFKIFTKILNYGNSWKEDEFIDNPRTLQFGKKTYRKLFNLLKTFVELEYIGFYKHQYLNDIYIRLENNYVYGQEESIFDVPDLMKSLRDLLSNYYDSFLISCDSIDLNKVVETKKLDSVWMIEKQVDEIESIRDLMALVFSNSFVLFND
jgi:hypothetical protein